MALYLDTGHGQDNRVRGVYDPGAEGAGTNEATVVRTLASQVLSKLQGKVDIRMAPDGYLADRIRWQAAHLTAQDTLVSFHMNSGGGTGTEVLYSATKTYLHDAAARVSASIAKALNLRDRGAKPDTDSHVGQVGILRVAAIPSLLIEFSFEDDPAQVADVLAHGAEAAANALLDLLGIHGAPAIPSQSSAPDTFTPSADQAAAFQDMIGIGVYIAPTPTNPGTPRTQERFEQAVMLKRLFRAGDARWLRLDGANRAA